jgi:hypothetical protein
MFSLSGIVHERVYGYAVSLTAGTSNSQFDRHKFDRHNVTPNTLLFSSAPPTTVSGKTASCIVCQIPS